MMIFALTTRNFVLKTRNCALKTRNCVLKMMNLQVKKGKIEPGDIENDDVMLLDCSIELFVLVGSSAPEGEKMACMVRFSH